MKIAILTILFAKTLPGVWSKAMKSTDVISSCTYEYLEEPNCQFYNDRSGLDYADWIKYYNKTPSEDTGPESAIGGKYYMYIETSTMNSGQNARLISSLLSTDTQLCLSFYYHMFGDSIGELQVIINTPGSNQIIFRKSNSQGNYWHYKQLFLQPASQFQVLVALRFFACGGFLQVVGDTIGIDKSTVSRCVQKVSDALNAKADQFIKWPSVQRKGDIKQGFFDNGGFPGVVGCIDGTHVRISAPSHDEPSFVNRKGYHSINTQAICDHEGRFTNVVARWLGSVHDSHIMRCSQVCTHLEESHLSVQDGLILGDSGYACRSFLMTPYLRPTEPCHEKFNKAHMKTRCCIERTFGWCKKRFNCLHQGIRMHPEKVCKIFMACAVLHNLAVEMKEPMDEYDNEIVNDDDLNIVFRGPDEGRIVRDHIARGFFS